MVSSRADVVTGGDALVAVTLPGTDPSALRVRAGGRAVTAAFTTRQSDLPALQAAFPSGVCDYSRPGVGQQPPVGPWVSFAAGPGGVSLGEAPASVPFGSPAGGGSPVTGSPAGGGSPATRPPATSGERSTAGRDATASSGRLATTGADLRLVGVGAAALVAAAVTLRRRRTADEG